ncbi:MAG TPA: hypothetical protein VNH11_02705 [Pirellulales bacterium]|nr:hypothetical protein [Pirellulales bacterium]
MEEPSDKRTSPPPTPAEIAACCAKIRAKWNHRTFRLRAGLPPAGLSVEVCETSVGSPTRRRPSTVEVD